MIENSTSVTDQVVLTTINPLIDEPPKVYVLSKYKLELLKEAHEGWKIVAF